MREVRVRAGRECVTSPVRVVWVWDGRRSVQSVCGISRGARSVKLLLSLRMRHGVYSLGYGVWVQCTYFILTPSHTRRWLT